MSLVSLFRRAGIYRSESDRVKLQEKAASIKEAINDASQIKDFKEPTNIEDCTKV
jgi:hypothetical protein